jgi:hypothetical protein
MKIKHKIKQDNRYSVIIQEGGTQRAYTALRKGNKLFYGENCLVGPSVVDFRNKSLISCIKLK